MKPAPALYIVDWLSWQNHRKSRDQEVAGMSISIHTLNTGIDILVCALIQNTKTALSEVEELQILQVHIRRGWPQNKGDLEPGLGGYWT